MGRNCINSMPRTAKERRLTGILEDHTNFRTKTLRCLVPGTWLQPPLVDQKKYLKGGDLVFFKIDRSNINPGFYVFSNVCSRFGELDFTEHKQQWISQHCKIITCQTHIAQPSSYMKPELCTRKPLKHVYDHLDKHSSKKRIWVSVCCPLSHFDLYYQDLPS